MKRLFTLLIFLMNVLFAYAQGNVIKANLTSLVLKDFYFSYERTFLEKFSINLGYDFMPTRGIPFSSAFPDVNGNPSPAIDMKVSGWRITPEFRFYTSLIKGAPKGFYVAPYFRYATYDFTLDDYQYSYNDIYDGNKHKTADVDYRGNYTSVGGGIMIGHQWILAKHVSLDFWIIGLGLGNTTFRLKASSEDLDPRYFEEGSDFTDDVESGLRVLNNVKLSTGADYVQADSKSTLLGIRGLGFNVGFAF